MKLVAAALGAPKTVGQSVYTETICPGGGYGFAKPLVMSLPMQRAEACMITE